ncbi:sugar ABC transporter ATP-binding protein [Anaerofilum hominis]|nr:sugar ABC transporter ATP-binding protein [Anaerofilum hominis]
MEDVILKMEGITKLFPGVRALDNVQLELRKGEVHAVIGENGAGKSTLMKILLGIYIADEGTIVYKGEPVRYTSPLEALSHGIAMIHQEISLIPTMDVAENIWLGREKRFLKGRLIDRKARYQATEELLEKLDIHLDSHAIVKNLSIAQMQLIEIARATSYDADVIIMDEPTSALTDVEIQLLYRIIRDLSARGVSIIFISHKIEELFEVCNRVSVYRDGHYIGTHNCDEITQPELINMIVGREMNNLFPKQEVAIGDTVLRVEHLSSAGVFDDVSFEVHRGEILGFCGLMGAGRTEIMRSIFGIDPHDSGKIVMDGKEVRIKKPKDAVRCGLGMVTEDRLRMGAIYALSVMANTTIAHFYAICNKLGFYRRSNEMQAFSSIRDTLSVKCSSHKQKISQLSGGNQQKVIIGRWLLTNPKVLILDEPTRGIDVGSKSEIHRLISGLAAQGMAIIMISSEMPEIIGMSDRILVVRHGKIVHECMREDATQEGLITYAFGAQAN